MKYWLIVCCVLCFFYFRFESKVVNNIKANDDLKITQVLKKAVPSQCVKVDWKILTPAIDDELAQTVASIINDRIVFWNKHGVEIKSIGYIDDSDSSYREFTVMETNCVDKLSLYPNGIRMSFKAKKCKTVDDIKAELYRNVDHEIGHIIMMRYSIDADTGNLYNAWYSDYVNKLGTYARSDSDEFFAESFSAYHNNKRDKVHPELVDLFQQIDKELNF